MDSLDALRLSGAILARSWAARGPLGPRPQRMLGAVVLRRSDPEMQRLRSLTKRERVVNLKAARDMGPPAGGCSTANGGRRHRVAPMLACLRGWVRPSPYPAVVRVKRPMKEHRICDLRRFGCSTACLLAPVAMISKSHQLCQLDVFAVCAVEDDNHPIRTAPATRDSPRTPRYSPGGLLTMADEAAIRQCAAEFDAHMAGELAHRQSGRPLQREGQHEILPQVRLDETPEPEIPVAGLW